MSLWYVGALVSVAGSVGSNLGINVQKFSFLENSRLPSSSQRPYTRQPRWVVGLALVILGSVGDFAALALAAQSIITPIGSVTLVANMVFAHFWLKETLSRADLTGTVLIIAGSVLTVSFGDHSDPTYSLSDFLRFFSLTSSIIYTLVIFAVSALMYGLILYLRPIKQEIVTRTRSHQHITRDSEREAAIKADARLSDLLTRYSPWEKVHPFCYCALSGLLGAQSVLFGKMVSELISTSIQGDNQLLSVYPYLFLLSMLFFIFSQLHFLALALTYFDALYCVPIFQCFFILTSTVGGAAFFEEFSSFTPLQMGVFPVGIATTLSGVFLLAQRDTSSVADAGEGPGHHVIPASLATFFVDLDRHSAQSRGVTRSWSHNWHHGGAMSKVQRDKARMQEEANEAALTAQKGEMKLSAEVEASVLREVSAVAHVGGGGGGGGVRHKRDPSRVPSSVTVERSSLSPNLGGLKSCEEEGGPPSAVDRERRKFKSRSHPTHFVTPSCLLPQSAVDELGAQTRTAASYKGATGTGFTSPVQSSSSMYPSSGVPTLISHPSLISHSSVRQTTLRRPAFSDEGLAFVPMVREQSEPVPRHLLTQQPSGREGLSKVDAATDDGESSAPSPLRGRLLLDVHREAVEP